ncbi:MAG TPA: glycosyltransferase family 39 protein [Vicinamibacterales bacterium]|nr:glycosyltransferase family 39 protein [Vicinamibacterales bacterium]
MRSSLDHAGDDPERAEGSPHPEPHRGKRRPVLTLLLLSSLTFFLGLGRQAITDSDEGFYAEAAREMVERGDWLTPHFNYSERWQKPALYYWLTAATYLVLGPTELAARLWSSLSGIGLVLLTFMIARRIVPEPEGLTPGPKGPGLHGVSQDGVALRNDTAWLAAAIVATCFGCFAMARLALPDLPLAFLVTLAIWAALEDKPLVAGAVVGLGFLMKGPLALVIPAIVLIPIWWHEQRLREIRPRDVAAAAAAFALIGLPWYGAMTFEHGSAYLESFLVGDNLERFATDRFNAPRPLWFYLPIVVGGLLPWCMYAVILPWQSVRDVARRRRPLTKEEWRLLAWAFIPLLFFTISIGKQPRYILPVLPPLAILLARTIVRRVNEVDDAPQKALAAATWATAVLFAIVAILLSRASPLFIMASPLFTYAGIALISASALVLAWLATTGRWQSLPTTMASCATVLWLSLQFGALAGAGTEPVEQVADLIRMHRQSGEPVGAYQVLERNLVFYTRVKQVDLIDEGRALDFLKSPERVLLVVRDTDLSRLESIGGITAKRLGEVQYLNTASVRLRTLISPLPEQDLERLLLVANR